MATQFLGREVDLRLLPELIVHFVKDFVCDSAYHWQVNLRFVETFFGFLDFDELNLDALDLVDRRNGAIALA